VKSDGEFEPSIAHDEGPAKAGFSCLVVTFRGHVLRSNVRAVEDRPDEVAVVRLIVARQKRMGQSFGPTSPAGYSPHDA
jgi:hypothetical protein